MMTAVDAQTRASSSTARMYESASRPAPPYSSGTIIPRIPISPSFGRSSRGNLSSLSLSATPGATSPSANSRTASRMRAWSSESSKFMGWMSGARADFHPRSSSAPPPPERLRRPSRAGPRFPGAGGAAAGTGRGAAGRGAGRAGARSFRRRRGPGPRGAPPGLCRLPLASPRPFLRRRPGPARLRSVDPPVLEVGGTPTISAASRGRGGTGRPLAQPPAGSPERTGIRSGVEGPSGPADRRTGRRARRGPHERSRSWSRRIATSRFGSASRERLRTPVLLAPL